MTGGYGSGARGMSPGDYESGVVLDLPIDGGGPEVADDIPSELPQDEPEPIQVLLQPGTAVIDPTTLYAADPSTVDRWLWLGVGVAVGILLDRLLLRPSGSE